MSLRSDPEAFYDWASEILDATRARWYDAPRYQSPFIYGSTRELR